jgi:hypothetical protein
MDSCTGRIYSDAIFDLIDPEIRDRLVPMALEPTAAQLARGKVGPYDACPCGSGAKFKFCCRAKARQRPPEPFTVRRPT